MIFCQVHPAKSVWGVANITEKIAGMGLLLDYNKKVVHFHFSNLVVIMGLFREKTVK